MVAFKVAPFGGMVPAVAEELLPDNAAALSQNTWLYTGQLVGFPALKRIYPPDETGSLLPLGTTKVYRIPSSYDRASYLPNSTWMAFGHPDTDVVRAPVFGDVHDRYYWASPTTNYPQYNTRQRIVDNQHPWTLGIHPPGSPPVIGVTGGSVRLEDVRVATVTAGVLATDFIVGKKVDDITLKLNDRILIKDQADQSQNGVRVVQTTGAPTRALDMDVATEFPKRNIKVREGITNAGTFWECTNELPIDVGVTDITFEEVAALPVQVTRSYVYTWVTEYGEESAPSPPVVVTGIQDGTWNISGLAVPDILDQGADPNAIRNIKKTRIYRTITSTFGVATFFLVKEQDCTDTTFADDISDDDVSQNATLESFSWGPPPNDLKGLTMMWNGMIAGFRENELWFCEPYRPHAWPAQYVLTLEYPIIGLGVADKVLVACTAGNPVTIQGSVPANLGNFRIAKFEPCTSRGSIISSQGGVLFTSPNGLILCNQGSAVNITKDLVLKDEWKTFAGEVRLRAAWLMEAYYAFGGSSPDVFEPTAFSMIANDPGPPPRTEEWVSQINFKYAREGVLIDPISQRVAFNVITSENNHIVDNVQNDPWSGELFIVKNREVWLLDIADKLQPVVPFKWRTKIFQTPDKRNIGAMRVYFKPTPDLPAQPLLRNNSLNQTLTENQWGLCRIYADGRHILTRELRVSGELWKLPSGFLADFWQYEIEARVQIINFQAASSAKELVTV